MANDVILGSTFVSFIIYIFINYLCFYLLFIFFFIILRWIVTRQIVCKPYHTSSKKKFFYKKRCLMELSFSHLRSTIQLIWEILVTWNLSTMTCPADSAPLRSCWCCTIWPNSILPNSTTPLLTKLLFMCCSSNLFLSISTQSAYIGEQNI